MFVTKVHAPATSTTYIYANRFSWRFVSRCLNNSSVLTTSQNHNPPPPRGGGHSGLKGEIGKNLKGFYEAFTRKKTAWPMPLKCNVIFYVNLWD